MRNARTQKTVGITLGDPAGIGPEVVLRSIVDDRTEELILFGTRASLEEAGKTLAIAVPQQLRVVEPEGAAALEVVTGEPSRAGGRISVDALELAVAAARRGEIDALVTAPISKQSARSAGFSFPGHTEFLADRLGATEVAMMFAGPRLRVVLATVHLPLRDVPSALTTDSICTAGRLAADAMRSHFGAQRFRLGVLGLNPHAGDGGLFGDEEERIIAPAVHRLRAELGETVTVEGPLVPDAAFLTGCDCYLAMYHDQALIPVKLLDFESAVNLTLGLPLVRTSPDHGVAYDIAGTGSARAESFRAALNLARQLLNGP